MRILEVCPFSAGICGVFSRVLSESSEFKKLGHEVTIFSSNIEKGTNNKVTSLAEKEGIKIKRFASKANFLDKKLSENVVYFNFEKEMFDYNPDIIITHLLHPHSAKVCRSLKKLKALNKNLISIIVPHAPFNVKRKFPLNIATSLWRKFSKLKLKKFDYVIAITKWEIPHLRKLGVTQDRIVYIPNGVSEKYFTQRKLKEQQSVLFLGRIAPIKNIELLVEASKLFPKLKFSIVGFPEEKYLKKLSLDIGSASNVQIYGPVYDLSEKIKVIDEHSIFILPSHREAMPQVLIEAMARGKVVIASDTDGARELIQTGINGYIFPRNDLKELVELISSNLSGNAQISNRAQKFAEGFSWENLIKKYLEIFRK